jgi:hypothetical protein
MDDRSVSPSPAARRAPTAELPGRRAEARVRGGFIPESFNDSLAYAQAVAQATRRLLVGTAITNVYLRHPTLLAQQAAAVQEFSGGRLLLGLGVGHRVVNRSLGIDMGDPLHKMREVIGVLRDAFVKGPHQPRPDPARAVAAALAPHGDLAGELPTASSSTCFRRALPARSPGCIAALGEAGGTRRRPKSITTCYLAPIARPARTKPGAHAGALVNPSTATCWPGFRERGRDRARRLKAKDVAAAEAAVSDGWRRR